MWPCGSVYPGRRSFRRGHDGGTRGAGGCPRPSRPGSHHGESALAPLAEDFQVLYFDLRGHGRSDHSSAAFWNVRTWADDLRRLCDALGLRKPVVLGSSFGGNVALTYAALFPR